MHPLTLPQIMDWMVKEYHQQATIFGIPARLFLRTADLTPITIHGDACLLPLGPAAGPHTQLTQNILTAYLCGARYFELKTVQVLDQLELAKPCIEAAQEGYNTEWSTELSISQALDEYTKAYLLIRVLASWLDLPAKSGKDFIFNVSVGYDLKGIQSPKVDAFIENMLHAQRNPQFANHLQTLQTMLADSRDRQLRRVAERLSRLSPRIADSVTLSTMHGCPPDEIEAIARYLLAEKGMHTYVKLNPTLLGFEKVHQLLDASGFGQIVLSPESFEHDLQYEAALRMITRLADFAQRHQRHFGIKLSNTLPVRNTKGYLPGEEMYLSGAALYPLTINLAARLARDLNGAIPISYSGGLTAENVGAVLATGIRPVTVATELLKPGGYLRLREMAKAAARVAQSLPQQIDLAALEALAQRATIDAKRPISAPRTDHKIRATLPLWDCFVAPCQFRCPIHQEVPCYLDLTARQQPTEALRTILRRNPLPNITGYICDQQCTTKCARNFYEAPLAIREMKRLAAEAGWDRVIDAIKPVAKHSGVQVAIVGGGPAGLAAAHLLARAGCAVTIFERDRLLGGTVRYLIPHFRLPAKAIDRDIELVHRLGVDIKAGVEIKGDLRELLRQGFQYVIIAIGALRPNHMIIEQAEAAQLEALDFLRAFNQKLQTITLGRRVVVVGGGNSAIDAARAARRVAGVQQVTIIYRRTIDLMPADYEELEIALQEGIEIKELLTPVRFLGEKGLLCQVMRLAERDASGRPRPVPVPDKFVQLPADKIILALGERVDTTALGETGCRCEPDGRLQTDPVTMETSVAQIFAIGDARRGPATVVEAVADAQQVAVEICRRTGLPLPLDKPHQGQPAQVVDDLISRRGIKLARASEATYAEGERCLQCGLLCGRCVEVCPNRANILIPVESALFENAWQVVHLDDLCNACGNCATFCPYEGQPYREKFSLYRAESNFRAAQIDGLYISPEGTIQVRDRGTVYTFAKPEELQQADALTPRTKALVTLLISRFPYLLR